MLPGLIIDGVLRGVLGGRRKRSRGAMRFLTPGGSLWSNPQALLTAAGLAWGIFETLENTGQSAAAAPGATPGAASTPAAASSSPVVPPPLPVQGAPAASGSTAPVGDDAMRIVRLAISAAHADGQINEHERAAVLQQAIGAGVGDLVERELQSPRPLKEIVGDVSDPAVAATLYVLAFTILRADEQLTGAERIYLAQLANLLHLDREKIEALEQDAGERIDALGDQGQPGG
jgi:uncharacterized membrane protein YebE (DUF533 family)